MKFLIAGAGALGSVFGGFLRRAGHQVTLLGRAAHVRAIAAEGLRIDGIWGEHIVGGFECIESPPAAGRFDAVLITVKSYDTRAMAKSVADSVGDGGVLISLQNGLGNVDAVAEIAGPVRTLGARVIFGALCPAPGRVRVTVFAEPNLIGAWRRGDRAFEPAAQAQARRLAEVFAAAALPSEYCDDVAAALWAKVFYNAALNPLGALLGVHYGALPEDEDARELMDRVIAEAFAVARAEGVALAWPDAGAYRRDFYQRLVPATYDHRSSMLQDLERGRRTEVDAINGEIWRRGAAHGIATPVNESLTRLLRARSRRRDSTSTGGVG